MCCAEIRSATNHSKSYEKLGRTWKKFERRKNSFHEKKERKNEKENPELIWYPFPFRKKLSGRSFLIKTHLKLLE